MHLSEKYLTCQVASKTSIEVEKGWVLQNSRKEVTVKCELVKEGIFT